MGEGLKVMGEEQVGDGPGFGGHAPSTIPTDVIRVDANVHDEMPRLQQLGSSRQMDI